MESKCVKRCAWLRVQIDQFRDRLKYWVGRVNWLFYVPGVILLRNICTGDYVRNEYFNAMNQAGFLSHNY